MQKGHTEAKRSHAGKGAQEGDVPTEVKRPTEVNFKLIFSAIRLNDNIFRKITLAYIG